MRVSKRVDNPLPQQGETPSVLPTDISNTLDEEGKRHYMIMSGLQQVSHALITATDLNDLLASIVEQATRLLGSAGGLLYLLNESLNELVVSAAVGTAKDVKGMHTPIQESLNGWVACHNKAVQCTADDLRINQRIAERIGAHAFAVAPLSSGDQVIGMLVIFDKRKGTAEFDASALELLQMLANYATEAINKMRLDARLRRRVKQLRVVNTILSQSVFSTDVDALLRQAASEISQAFGYWVDLGMIEQDQLVFKATASHRFQRAQDNPECLPLGKGITGTVSATGKSKIVPDVTQEPLHHPYSPDTRSELAVPLLNSKRKCIGVLNVESKELGDFSREDLQIFEAIAAGITLAIENAHRRKQISEAEGKYRRLYQSARDPIIITNYNGTIIDVNEETCRVSGYARNELLGMDVVELITDAHRAEQARVRLARVSSGDRLAAMEFPLRHKNGSTFSVEDSLTPIIDETGKVIAIQSIWRDITARKQTEARIHRQNQQLQSLLEISRAVFRPVERDAWLAEVAQGVMSLLESDKCYIHLRTDKAEEMEPFVFPGSTVIHQWWPSPLKVGGRSIIEQVALTGQGEIANNIHERPDALSEGYRSEIPPQHLLTKPLKSNEKVLGVISVTRWGRHARFPYNQEDDECLEGLANMLTLALEYTRLAEIQHKQQAAQKVLEQVSLVGTFLGHKMGGFLGAVALTAKELSRRLKQSDATTGALLENLLLSSRTATHMVNQFRSMEKPLYQHLDTVSLAPLVSTAMEQAQVPMRIRLRLDHLEALPSVKANGPLLIEVFEGIIRNAIEAMPDSGTLSIGGSTRHDRYEVRLSFTDTGHGMSEATLKALFAPFFTTKKDKGGIGLGLWLSRLYLQALGGDIEVASTWGHGTTITVCLPAVQEAFPASGGIPKATKQEDTSYRFLVDSQYSTPRVLVIDDDPLWKGILIPMLRLRGCEVHVATNRDEAVQALYQLDSFNAFVVDVRLEDYNAQNQEGLDLVNQILDRNASALIIIISGYSAQIAAAQERFGDRKNVRILSKSEEDTVETVINDLSRHLVAITPR